MATQHQKNVQYLLSQGVSQNFIDAEIAKGGSGLAHGKNIDDKDVEGFLSAWKVQKDNDDAFAQKESILPESLKNDPSYQTLPMDMKEIVIYNYEIQKANDADKAKKLASALEQATSQADPYWKSIIRVAQDEVLRAFEAAEGDYTSTIERQQRNIQEINQDLVSNKEFLTLEQQSELANLSRNYQIQKEQTINAAADSGLTFSSKRKLAEQRLAEANQSMVESTKRTYNKQIKDLQTQAERGSAEAQIQIADLQRRMKESYTDIGRSAEKYLGTENLPTFEGYNPLGDVTGDIYEKKVQDIETRKQGIYNELNQGSLNLSLNNLI